MSKIDKNVPITAHYAAKAEFPLTDIKVGDSFYLPKERARSLQQQLKVTKRHHPALKFATRAEDEGRRRWRTE